MTKQAFLEQLNQLLCDIPKTEREEAILYYEEYFDEANIGPTDNVLEIIDSPEKIAASIRAGLQENEDRSEFTERGYYEEGAKTENELMRKPVILEKEKQQESWWNNFKKKVKDTTTKLTMDKQKLVLVVIILVLTFPIWGGLVAGALGIVLGLLGGVLGIIVGVLGAVLGIVVGIVTATFGFLGKGIILVVTGVIGMLEVPTVGVSTIGLGLVHFGIGMLCLMLMVWIFSAMLPACIRGIRWIIRRLQGKKE